MNSRIIALLFVISNIYANAQQRFGHVAYKVPLGWSVDTKRTDVAQLTIMDAEDGAYAMAGIYPAQQGVSSANENFKQAWEQITQQSVQVTVAPQMDPANQQNGWEIISGSAPFQDRNRTGMVSQWVATQQARYIAIVIITNSSKYQASIDEFIESLMYLPLAEVAPETKPALKSAIGQNFTFHTTNFDDGWTATAETDFVRVTKGTSQVLVHYPNATADAYNSVLRDGLLTAWNILVAPRYTNIRNFELKPIQSFESISFAEADGVDKASGKSVHIVLFKKHFSNGNGRYLEFTAPDKQQYEQEFGAYHNDEFGWDKLVNMQNRNKFAVAAADLTGTWSASDYASLTYFYVNGGGYAGATATSIAHEFTFNANGTYQSDHAGGSGVVGNQKFSRQVYSGTCTTNHWTMTLTNRFKGETETYSCQFEAIKGGRILLLTDRLGTVYTLVKRQ